MKTKQGVSLKTLNPIFDNPLKKFDSLHIGLTGNEAVVTSVDTGKHWGSIKKEDRPDDWEFMSTKEVKLLSDSKHYTKPCDALDFRRRNPDTDSNLDYFDDLTESEQRVFRTEIYECFPDELFDVVFSRLCIHVESDPDFDVRKTHKLTDEDLEPREPAHKREAVKEKKVQKREDRKAVVGTLERLWFELDSKAVLMGTANFLTARLTGFRWFKNKIKVKDDQTFFGRLLELINVILNKMRGTRQ